ncbi:conjugal transfer protein, partial [Escherichia coli]|nr:conjugal transfer protein [Escherichia coli]EHT5317827.1 conjugal transfer protein [Salmonella enterica subsp. enterica serovar Schwarzengrund]ELE1900267.1 conjugal transfer protein [Salmonella enterica subsp. enterica serovar Typhimurium]EER4160406.1 conjugal transfer protein [Escherichia coli]EER8648636.1 conjugal transfer protein [Escherichia coli]
MQVAQLKDSKNKNVASMYPEYMYHISDSVVYTLDRKMLATIAIQGIPFEFASDSFLENSFNGIKDYLVGVGKEGDVYLWTHFI